MRVSPTRIRMITTSASVPQRLNAQYPTVKDVSLSGTQRRKSLTATQIADFALNWCLWCFLMFLMLSQLLTAIRNTTTSSTAIVFGQDPSHGLYAVPGYNDVAVSLNDALNSRSTIVEDSSGSAIHGYRVINRTGFELSDDSKQTWTRTCRLINSTLHGILSACEVLGYSNLTRDSLRVVNGLESKTLKSISNALPILIMPFWDTALSARFAIPSWDGNACVFRLQGQYQEPSVQTKLMVASGRANREKQTELLLGRVGGTWKNGWYEDSQGMRWYSDIMANDPQNDFGVPPRYIDLNSEQEFVCDINSDCALSRGFYNWSADLISTSTLSKVSSLTILNGMRFGIFYFHSVATTAVSCVYDFASLMSNATVVLLLTRWMIAMVALHRGFAKGLSDWHSASIGSIACSSEFTYLPVMMLPRLKMILAAFFTVGCNFEGEQKALADAWFVIYPSIVDIVLIYPSLLNIVAKIFRRRMNDWIFPFAIVALSCTHYFRPDISELLVLKLGGQINAQMESAEFDRLTLVQMFSPDTALRLNGNVSIVLWWKLLLLSFSGLSMVFSDNMALNSRRFRHRRTCRCEHTLKIRACNVGGVGRTKDPYGYLPTPDQQMMSSYELIRLGYIVVSDRYLVIVADWWILSTTKPVRYMYSWWNYRIMVFLVHKKRADIGRITVSEISPQGKLVSLQDPALDRIAWWDIDARSLL